MNSSRDKPPKVEAGATFGHLKILKVNSDNKTCLCECVCSNKVTLPIKEVKYGRKLTCGCRTRNEAPLKEGMIVREVKLLKREIDKTYPTGKKRCWLVECIYCGHQRTLRQTDIVTQRIGICPKCKNKKEKYHEEIT